MISVLFVVIYDIWLVFLSLFKFHAIISKKFVLAIFPSVLIIYPCEEINYVSSTEFMKLGIQPYSNNDDVIKWKHFPRYWPFVRGMRRWLVISLTQASDAEFDVFLNLCLNKRLSKQSRHRWLETLSRWLWRHGDVFPFFPENIGIASHLRRWSHVTQMINILPLIRAWPNAHLLPLLLMLDLLRHLAAWRKDICHVTRKGPPRRMYTCLLDMAKETPFLALIGKWEAMTIDTFTSVRSSYRGVAILEFWFLCIDRQRKALKWWNIRENGAVLTGLMSVFTPVHPQG